MKSLKEQSEYLHNISKELTEMSNNNSDFGISAHILYIAMDAKNVARRIDTQIRKSLNSIYNSVEKL